MLGGVTRAVPEAALPSSAAEGRVVAGEAVSDWGCQAPLARAVVTFVLIRLVLSSPARVVPCSDAARRHACRAKGGPALLGS